MLPIPNGSCGLCGRKAALKNRAQDLCESRGSPSLANSPYVLCSINLYVELCESRGSPSLPNSFSL